jgi:protein-tyrosine phosphatase
MKILMVCLGNICRSPMADALLRKKVEHNKLDVIVDGCGTAAYHIGNPPDSRMIATGEKYKVDLTPLRARQFEVSDFDNFDLIYVMDQSNYDNVIKLARNLEDEKKVCLILDLIDSSYSEVPDPYYGGDSGFDLVYDLLDEATDKIINKINV